MKQNTLMCKCALEVWLEEREWFDDKVPYFEFKEYAVTKCFVKWENFPQYKNCRNETDYLSLNDFLWDKIGTIMKSYSIKEVHFPFGIRKLNTSNSGCLFYKLSYHEKTSCKTPYLNV